MDKWFMDAGRSRPGADPVLGRSLTVAKRSNLACKIMVRSENKYLTLGIWVFGFVQRDGKGRE